MAHPAIEQYEERQRQIERGVKDAPVGYVMRVWPEDDPARFDVVTDAVLGSHEVPEVIRAARQGRLGR